MKRFVALGLALVITGLGASQVLADAKSGLTEGERVGAYTVKDVTGPSAGKELCYRCQFGNKPVVNVFARNVDDSFVALIKEVDAKMAEDDSLNGFVTFLTDDPEAAAKELREVAKKNNIKKLPLTVFKDAKGPESYKIAKDSDITVMMWVNSEVKANHAYGKGEMCSECVKNVVADIPKILK